MKKTKIQLVNLTSQDVKLVNGLEIKASGQRAKVTFERERDATLECEGKTVKLWKTRIAKIELPPPQDGVMYIVPAVYLYHDSLKDRDDLMATSHPVIEKGKFIGYRGFDVRCGQKWRDLV